MTTYIGNFQAPEDSRIVFRAAYENNPANLQKAILALRNYGCRELATMQVLIAELDMSLADAKNTVALSDAWNN